MSPLPDHGLPPASPSLSSTLPPPLAPPLTGGDVNAALPGPLLGVMWGSPEVRAMLRTERTIPQAAFLARRALRLWPTANAATLALLGRLLRAAGATCGYIQLVRLPADPLAQEALATIKVACRQSGYLATARAGHPTPAGPVSIDLSDQARQALLRIESTDPILGSTPPLKTEANPGGKDFTEEWATVYRGVTFPPEAL